MLNLSDLQEDKLKKYLAGTRKVLYFQYKNRNTFRENYLNPLKQLGFIMSTKPDTPNAPDNKYVITEQGKAFLMGR